MDSTFASDSVNHPTHYTQGEIECIVALQSALTAEEYRGFLKGCVFKYLWRDGRKGPDDIKKADWYLGRLLKTTIPNDKEEQK